jgi:hypothetical protein
MKRIAPAVCLLLSLAVFSCLDQGPLHAADLKKQLEEQYLPNLPTLMDRYVHNRKLVATDRRYNATEALSQGKQPVPFGEIQLTAIADAQTIRVHWGNARNPTLPGIWLLVRPHELFEIRRNEENSGFVLKEHLPAGPRHEDARVVSSLMLPMMYGNSLTLEYWLVNPYKVRLPEAEVLSMTPTTLEGRPVTEVKIRERDRFGPWLVTLYIDIQNGWIIRKKTIRPDESQPGRGPDQDYGAETEIHYKDSAEGYPLPTRYVRYRLGPNGTRAPERIVEIHEYSRYTPDPSELTLESFDFTEPKKTTPNESGSHRWLFRLAAVVCIMLGAFFLLRRSRKKRPPPPAPTTQ